jgi:hypothetical protein
MWQWAQKHQFAALRAVPAGHQPVGRHRALGEPENPDDTPIPSGHLQAHRIEQPADVRDGTGPGRPAQRRQVDRCLHSQAAAGAFTVGIWLWRAP